MKASPDTVSAVDEVTISEAIMAEDERRKAMQSQAVASHVLTAVSECIVSALARQSEKSVRSAVSKATSERSVARASTQSNASTFTRRA